MSESFLLQKHVEFLTRHLNVFPEQYCSLDTNRVTLLFFAVSALDLLGELNTFLTEQRKKSIIDWIYKLQVTDPDPGWRGFGGLLTDPCTDTYIPQYNLAAYWKRPVAPVITGHVEPITSSGPSENVPRRPPGSFRCDLDSNVLKNVNLLAASRLNQKKVVIWRVTERSTQQAVEELKAKVHDGVVYSQSKIRHQVNVGEPILELRSTMMKVQDVWVRCKRHLSLVSPKSGDHVRVFRSAVRCFEENTLLPGDVTLCDMGGMVWSGPIGSSLSRTKSSCNDIKLITHSDHPRIVSASSSHEVRTFDLRLDSLAATNILFVVPEFSRKGPLDHVAYVPGQPLERPSILHLRSFSERPNNFLVVTSHTVFLCDDRFPKHAVLTLPHIIPYGAGVLHTVAAARDPLGSGHVFSAYFLDHLLTDISVLRLYSHECELWSSVLPIHTAGHCLDYEKIMRPSSILHGQTQTRDPTMGMAVVQGFEDSYGRQTEFLLRCLSDGSVWCQTMRYGRIDCGEMKELWTASQLRLQGYLEARSREEGYFERLPQELLQSVSSSCALVDVEMEGDKRLDIQREPLDPMKKEIFESCNSLKLLEPSHPESVLPSIVNSVWEESMRNIHVFTK